ncbi:MAG TPA: hypothetical protein VFE50_19585 [Cyclobacteriaceae bacterium]|nr:hypothetical protein [Cyclobacteriaceae bacterium]
MKASASKVEPFEEFLRRKAEKDGERFDWDSRRSKWLESVDNLYQRIGKWLKPFEDKGLLAIDFTEIELYEGRLGHYKIRQLDIFMGKTEISLIPKGTLVLGGLGRIDMRGPAGELMFVLFDNWGEWQLARRSPGFESWHLSKRSFQDALKIVIDGEATELYWWD